jgi:hypothetical protein
LASLAFLAFGKMGRWSRAYWARLDDLNEQLLLLGSIDETTKSSSKCKDNQQIAICSPVESALEVITLVAA